MLDVNDEEPSGIEEVLEVDKPAKLITKVITTVGVDVNAASIQDTLIIAAEATKVIVKVPKPRKRRGVIIQDPEETATTITMQPKLQANNKGKAILIEEPKPLKRQVQIDLDEEIVPDDDDDMYVDATPLVSKIPIVDYKIHTERNKPYFKIIRADRNHKLFMSFSIMMKNFDREDLESLWKIIRKNFENTKPKNYTNDYLLNTHKIMFENPNVEANVWKDQKGKHGLVKVKSWKLFDACGVHCLTLLTTQIFLLVKRMYPLTHFTLEQMVNDVRLEVDDESEMSLELLRLVKR
uniref:Uncharacterized protein n=1 Tax=Tanacetum cinerariifolium TaxID=118510 RepID=A0A6L2L882_TANCI|nr:hypothetical protein [Tanacetum cinerariifolium]